MVFLWSLPSKSPASTTDYASATASIANGDSADSAHSHHVVPPPHSIISGSASSQYSYLTANKSTKSSHSLRHPRPIGRSCAETLLRPFRSVKSFATNQWNRRVDERSQVRVNRTVASIFNLADNMQDWVQASCKSNTCTASAYAGESEPLATEMKDLVKEGRREAYDLARELRSLKAAEVSTVMERLKMERPQRDKDGTDPKMDEEEFHDVKLWYGHLCPSGKSLGEWNQDDELCHS